MARSKRKRSLFKKLLLGYTVVASILVVIFLVYIINTLNVYESNQPTNFIKSSIASLSDTELKKYLSDNNLDESLLSIYKEQITDKDLKVIKSGDNSFEVSLNNRTLFNVDTKYIRTDTKLGMFSYEVREVTEIKPNLERGLIYIDVTIPSNYTLYVDGKVYEEVTKSEEYKNLSYMYASSSMPTMNTYEIDNLTKEVSIKVEDPWGKEVSLKQNKFSYKLEKNYLEFETYEDAKEYLSSEIDVSEFAHNWSLYLTRDLKGTSHGFNSLKTYFIKDTEMYTRAYNWATGIDIMFTSKHTLKDPTFTNESISNFVVYGKDAFSCEVYLEKNMVVAGKDQVDVMHDYIYFVKENDTWKVVNIKAGE